ncbi:MAG: hypothetical protein ABI992_08230, partial [Chthoniobacterales bacterium]
MMKNYLFALCLAIAALFGSGHLSQAQTPRSWAQSYGVGSYGGNFRPVDDPFYGSGTDVPRAMAEMPDGGMVVAGQIDFPKYYAPFVGNPGTSGRANAVLVRYGADGTVLWQHELHQNNDRLQYSNGNGYYYAAPTRVSQIVVDAAGNIFVAGGKGNPDNGGSSPFVGKFSSNGDLLWQKGMPTAALHVPGQPPADFTVGVSGASFMSATNDGGVVVSLLQGKPNFVNGVVPVLAKFNADGTLALYRAYENMVNFYGDSPVAQSRDGSRYVMAFYSSLPNGSGGSLLGTLLILFDASGNILAQNGWLSPDGGGEQPVALISTSDGGFASLSYIADYDGGVLRKYNADLSATAFVKRIKGASPRHLLLNSLAETLDGGFLISGETAGPDSPASGYDGLLMNVNAAGALQFSSLIGGPRSEGGPASNGPSSSFAIALANGGYGFAGTTTSYTTDGPLNGGFSFKSDWWAVRTDA